jgi:hypothetical protein
MPAQILVYPASAHFRDRPDTSLCPPKSARHRLAAGDEVRWRNPSMGCVWDGLTIEFVYPTIGIALVRGCFGRMNLRTGGDLVESRRLRLDQLTLQRSAATREVL